MKQILKLKKDLTSPRWKHCVSAIKKGTKVECLVQVNGDIIATHPKEKTLSILIYQKNVKKYFDVENEYEVVVTRTSYASRTFVVKAKTEKEAEEKALEDATNHEFREHDADYGVDYVGVKE